MQVESDPNIIYGGDLDESAHEDYSSLGDMLVKDMKIGGNLAALV